MENILGANLAGNKMKTWVTIFERFESIHLNKDVGQIIYHAAHFQNINASLWRKSSYEDRHDYPFEVVNIKTKRKGCKISPAIIVKLIRNAKKIDILNLFHFRIYTLLYASLYKIVNPKGKVIIKCDFSSVQEHQKNDSILKNIFFSFLRNINAIDLLLIEHKGLIKKFTSRGFNCRYTPNGVSEAFYNISEKIDKNIIPTIVFVGKCGDKRKNAEELISSLCTLPQNIKWKAYFIGGETDEFLEWYKINSSPFVKSRCIFVGQLSDISRIHRIYSESHIFAMTSKQEGYPLSLAEACWVGCFPILSINSGGADLSASGAAAIYKNKDDLSLLLKKHINDIDLTITLGKKAETVVKNNNDWRILLDDIKGFINE